MVTEGFTGDRVADALAIEGVDVMVIYGPEYDLWVEGIDPEMQAAMAARTTVGARRCARRRTAW